MPTIGIVETFDFASFDSVEFPWTGFDVKLSLDHYLHKYIHRPGGVVEDLGRHPYEFRFHCEFHETSLPQWQGKYPANITKIVELAESGETHLLNVPGVGVFEAKLIGLDRKFVAKVLSGESVELTFLEDSTEAFSMQALFGFITTDMPTQHQILLDAFAAYEATLSVPEPVIPFDPEKGPFDDLKAIFAKLGEAIGAVMFALNVAEFELLQVTTRIEGVMALCAQADAMMGDPNMAASQRALYQIWLFSLDLQSDLFSKSQALEKYTTPHVMSIAEVSMAIYGTTYAQAELMKLNSLASPLQIPADTDIFHYPN